MVSDIRSYFSGNCVFLTGATGFMGTVLLEKLLRSCPEILKIYILIRSKGASQGSDRLTELLSSKAFDTIRRTIPVALCKVIPVYGDLSDPSLNIRDPEVLNEIQQHVTNVFHLAANVKFTENLKKSVECNSLGTVNLLTFCRTLSKLEAVVHVSTAYTNCDKDEVEEKFYKMPIDAVEFVKDLSEASDYTETTSSFSKLPNSYNFSKALAEQLIEEEFQDLPLAVVRPTTVLAASKEPEPGWLSGNLGVATEGVVAGIAKGIIRTLRIDCTKVIDYIPVDYVTNACIAAAWYRATFRLEKMMIYHVGTSHLNPLTWEDFRNNLRTAINKSPTKGLVWYPSYTMRKSDFLHALEACIFHQLPANLMDLFATLSGKKPFMVRLYRKISQMSKITAFYTTNQTIFYSDNLVKLHQSLLDKDQEIFSFDVTKLNWASYTDTYYNGVRTHLLKDNPATIPTGRIMLKRMRMLQLVTRMFIFCGISLLFNYCLFSFSPLGLIS